MPNWSILKHGKANYRCNSDATNSKGTRRPKPLRQYRTRLILQTPARLLRLFAVPQCRLHMPRAVLV
jgi:hypothetical protein